MRHAARRELVLKQAQHGDELRTPAPCGLPASSGSSNSKSASILPAPSSGLAADQRRVAADLPQPASGREDHDAVLLQVVGLAFEALDQVAALRELGEVQLALPGRELAVAPPSSIRSGRSLATSRFQRRSRMGRSFADKRDARARAAVGMVEALDELRARPR